MKHANCEYVSPRQFKLERDELKGIEYLEHQLFYIKKKQSELTFLFNKQSSCKGPKRKVDTTLVERREKSDFFNKNYGYWSLRATCHLTTVQNDQYYNSLDKYVKAEDFVVNNEDYFDRFNVVSEWKDLWD